MSTDRSALADLRREIDQIDNAIHDQLMRRGELQAEIGRAKTSSEVYLRPGREAMVLRRLIARHRGPFPKAVLVRIWREIFAAGLSLQNQFSVAVLADGGRAGLGNLARDHFGSLTPIREAGSAPRVLQMVADGDATVGVLPMPESEEAEPWWLNLTGRADRTPRIVARLPFAPPISTAGRAEALAVGLSAQEDTGDDRAYLVVETGGQASRSAVKRAIEAAGFRVRDWKSGPAAASPARALVEVDGCVAPDDPRLAELPRAGGEAVAAAWSVGGYASPLRAEELA
jgi:chorismate mutase